MRSKRVFICYLDDSDKKIEGFFDLIDEKPTYIKFRTGENILLIPYSRILKIKMPKENEL